MTDSSGRAPSSATNDFVGTVANSRSTFAVAIDGGSGRVLWAKRQQGLELGGTIDQKHRQDLNPTC